MTNRFMLTAISLATLLALPSARAEKIVNGTFDSGLAGWDYSAQADPVPDPDADDPYYSPWELDYKSWNASVTQIAGAAQLSSCGGAESWRAYESHGRYRRRDYVVGATATLSQTFYAQAGDVLSFDYDSSYPPNTTGSSVGFSVGGLSYPLLPGWWFDPEEEPQTHIDLPLTQTGATTLCFWTTADDWDISRSSTLTIDNVRVTPEPSTLVLVGIAVVSFVASRPRRRRRQEVEKVPEEVETGRLKRG